MKKRIALLFGGAGREHEISCLSAKNIFSLIDRHSFSVLPIGISKDGEWFICDGEPSLEIFSDKKRLKSTYPIRLTGKSGFLVDGKITEVFAAFPVLHGDLGEDGVIQGALTAAGIPFVGCKTLAGAVAADKITAKLVAKELGIPTVKALYKTDGRLDSQSIDTLKELAGAEIGYPMFIKPSGLGSSIGASAVPKPADFEEAYRCAVQSGDGRVLIERMLTDKRELECAYMKTGALPLIPEPAEISTKDGFYSFIEKYSDTSQATLKSKASIPQKIKEKVCAYTARLAGCIGCSGLARVDFFLVGEEVYFNEINTMPGMTGKSLWLSIIEGYGIPKSEIVTRLLLSARNDNQKAWHG